MMNESYVTTIEQPQTFSLEFLVKLISDTFDGDRYKLRSLIKQTNVASDLDKSLQYRLLPYYVKSKITGKTRERVDIYCNLPGQKFN